MNLQFVRSGTQTCVNMYVPRGSFQPETRVSLFGRRPWRHFLRTSVFSLLAFNQFPGKIKPRKQRSDRVLATARDDAMRRSTSRRLVESRSCTTVYPHRPRPFASAFQSFSLVLLHGKGETTFRNSARPRCTGVLARKANKASSLRLTE